MEQYKTIDEAMEELKEKYERPVVVEQFTNPKPVEKSRGIISVFVNQAVLCLIIIIGFIIAKFAFPDESEKVLSLIIENITSIA